MRGMVKKNNNYLNIILRVCWRIQLCELNVTYETFIFFRDFHLSLWKAVILHSLRLNKLVPLSQIRSSKKHFELILKKLTTNTIKVLTKRQLDCWVAPKKNNWFMNCIGCFNLLWLWTVYRMQHRCNIQLYHPKINFRKKTSYHWGKKKPRTSVKGSIAHSNPGTKPTQDFKKPFKCSWLCALHMTFWWDDVPEGRWHYREDLFPGSYVVILFNPWELEHAN